MMNEIRESLIRQWFASWLTKDVTCIDAVFAENAVYRESYGPLYNGIKEIQNWFDQWNQKNTVLQWDIHEILHNENTSAVSWRFSCHTGRDDQTSSFDGMTLIRWNESNRIFELIEYACREKI